MKKGLAKVYALSLTVIVVVAVAAAAYFILSSSSTTVQQQTTTQQIHLVDIVGRNVTIPRGVDRIVAIGPGMLRLVCYLNATDLLVGVEDSERSWGSAGRDYAMAYGESFKALPAIGPGGPGKPPAPELILAAKPELIIMSRTYCDFYDPDRLEKETNTTVIVMDYGPAGNLDVEGLTNALRVLGEALGRKERADSLISYIRSVVEDLDKRTRDLDVRPKVYVGAVSYKGPQPFTTTQTPFPPLSLLNTPSIADRYASKPGVFFWSFEAILSEQPEIVFIDENNLATVKQDFDKDPGKYMHLNAFKEGRVYGILPYNYYHTNVAVALADAYYIGKILYPERFSDVNPSEKADEIFRVFVGKALYQQYAEAYGGFRCLAEMFKPSG